MNKKIVAAGLVFLISFNGRAQEIDDAKTYYAGFKALTLVDTSRMYKPNTSRGDRLHYRPVDLDIWYPSSTKGNNRLTFGDLFGLFEKRATQYQDTIYAGIAQELAQFYAIELGQGNDGGAKLMRAQSNSYPGLQPARTQFPLIIYMAGFNGMGFENFKILERLAERGFIVVSVWSVGRYPGNMTNHKLDMMEQVYDAEFALDFINSQNELIVKADSVGVLACSWGGMSAAAFVDRNSVVSSFVSLDGTETHYFRESDEDDTSIREIHHSNLLNPETTSVAYLYFESGNKFEEYSPTEEYQYYKKLNSRDKYYLRLLNSKHEDFTCFPSTLQPEGKSAEIHNQIMEGVVLFFEKVLLETDSFKSYYRNLSRSNNISTKPFDQNYNNLSSELIEGEILDAKTGSPLAYVNIGVLNKESGTVSNGNGRYELHIKSGMEMDTIRVSMIGYKAKQFLVKDLLSQSWNAIELEVEVSKLKEVVISAKELKTRTLGNKTTSKFISAGFGYDQLGAELGIKINVREQPTFVDTFNFNISYNRLSAKALFRLNIYEIESGRPSKNIMTENIIIPIEAKQTGLISVDLKQYDIELRNDVIATLEWVKSEGENNKGEAIFFSLGVFNSGTLVKRASQGKFKKYSKMGVGMNFDVRY